MLDAAADIVIGGWIAALHAVSALAPAAAVFLALGIYLRGPAILTDIRRAAPESRTNLTLLVLNSILLAAVTAPCATFLVWVFVTNGLTILPPAVWSGVPGPVIVLIGIVIGDFVGYWRHRLEHTRLLWPGHAVHHSDTQASWLTAGRGHPLNVLLFFAIDDAALLLLGLPVEAIVANALIRSHYGHLTHANLPWTYGPLGNVFVSPASHRWHHATDDRAFNTNFANFLSVFDHMFGTYRMPGLCDHPLGVRDRMGPGLAGQLTYPFTAAAYVRRRRPTPGASSGAAGRLSPHTGDTAP